MGHGHAHGHVSTQGSASARYLRRLLAALIIGAVLMLGELAVGVLTSSLALLSDAAHMFTDVFGIGMALAAILVARRSGPTYRRTFGLYRAEVLAALGNAVLLFGVAGYVLYEAISRIANPPEIPGVPVLVAATGGLIANLVAYFLLRSGAKESLNVRGAYLEVLADLLGSLGVLASGALTMLTGWRYVDPILGVAIGLFVLPRTYALAKRSLRILFQHAPRGIDVAEISADLAAVADVDDVHDLHVWTLTSGMEVASAHLTVAEDAEQERVLAQAQQILAARYQIEHATVQVERRESAQHCAELAW